MNTMTDFPYVNTIKRFEKFLSKLQDVGRPSEVDLKWRSSIGYDKPDDGRFISVLKFIDFIDDSNKPTEAWKSFRTGQSTEVMAAAVRDSYSELFDMYSDANRRGNDDLTSFFKNHSDAGSQVIRRIVTTFLTLCSFAEFDAQDRGTSTDYKGKLEKIQDIDSEKASVSKTLAQPAVHGESEISSNPVFSPEVNINIQIHIAADAKDDQIEKIFSSMAANLFGNRTGS